ncbi:MAG: DUF4870 domain-containing protein [Ignavibacteriaceae bacterium]
MKTFLHISALIPIPLFTLPVWFFTLNKKPQIAFIAAKIFNFQLSLITYLIAGVMLIPLYIGFALIIFLILYYTIFIIKNIKKAAAGNLVYPYSIKFL